MYHPIPVKSRDETRSIGSDLLCFIAELKECSVAVDEPGRIGERDAKVECLD